MNKEQLRDEFSAGMRSWGAHNLPSARSNFKWCASLDPNSNDVIRAMSAMENGGEGPATPEQIERLWQTRESYGELLVASGYPPDLISASYATGMWGRDQKLRTKADTPLAYACLLIQRESWEEASKVLKEANSGIPFTSIVKGFLNYRTKRWGDVLSHCDEVATASLFNDQDRLVEPLVADVLVQGLSSLMAGEALTHLERYESAIARLEFATGVSDNLISARAYYITGLAYRAKGDENNAQRAFALSLARNNDAEVVKAAEDENVRISTTSEEMIAARSDPWDHHTEPSLVKKREDASEDERKRLLREADEELDSFIGMDSVKHQIRKLKARVKAAQERDARGLKSGSASQHILFTGPPGCIQGDALISVNRCGKGFQMPLRDVVRKFNGQETRKDWAWDLNVPTFVQREVDGVVRLAELAGAWYSGTKTTYTVTTSSGRSLRATDEHPFLTTRGWLRLDELCVGDEVHVRGSRSSRGRASKPRYRTMGIVNHPFARSRNRVAIHRLTAEASINGMKLDDFVTTVRRGDISTFKFLDPAVWAVHHKDNDSSNNHPDNLQVLTHSEHHRLHAADGDMNNVALLIDTETVVSVEKFGEEDTYDIEVKGDPHNFIANGFVVHNTGKTTIARVIGKLYAGLGITRSSQVLETGRPDLVGETVGSSALKTRALINKARGGLLFIDEAYSLVQEISQTQKDAFGKEALDVIVAEMENNRDDLVVIMAGYPQDIERLLATNEGLKSRFPRSIEFQSYTAEELWKIACGMAEANGSVLSPDAEHILREKVRNPLMTRNHEGKLLLDLAGNGRFVRNVVERAEEERELRLLDEADARGISMGEFTDQELVTISPVDVETALEAIILKYLD